MAPRIVPRVDVRRGELVRPTGPRAWESWAGREGGAAAAQLLYEKHQSLYVWDVDGNEFGEANLDFYQRLERAHVFPWVDAGCRNPEDVMDVFFAGSEAVTIQLRHMGGEALREVAAMAEADLYVGVGVERGELERRMRPRELIELVRAIDATGVVLYEGASVDFHAAENIAGEIQRNGFPVTWAPSPGSASLAPSLRSERFATLAVPEGRA